jgi:hypothetical protein
MDKARETQWHENWSEARKAKEQRRAANREAWANSPQNAANRYKDKFGAVAPEIAAEPNGEGGSGSLAQMQAIMADASTPLYRRIDAAEVVLAYELGPGAAVDSDPEQIAASSYRFLRTVVDTVETPEALRFRALKSIVAIENRRKSAGQGSEQSGSKRELQMRLVNGARRQALIDAGVWADVVRRRERWSLDLNDEFDWLPGWPGTWQWPPSDFKARFEYAKKQLSQNGAVAGSDEFRAKLRAVRARNRVDDWERLLSEAASPAEGHVDSSI